MKVSANRNQIYIGESFILEITVSGSTSPAEVDFSCITNVNIRALGTRNISNYQITIVNGKMTREGFTGFVSSYELTPLTPGRFRAGPINVQTGGKILTDDGPVVLVTDIEKQERVVLAVTASRETALIDEPFQVKLNLKIRAMAGEAAASEPLFPDQPPALTIPWLDQEMAGLAGPDIRKLLTGYLAPHWNEPGITINKYTLSTDPFDIGSMFLREPRKAKFALPFTKTRFNGQTYYEYGLVFDYVPKDEGNYVFGPVVFKGGVPERLNEHGQAVGPNIFAIGPACTVRVIPPPDEGRPESYSGAIGSNLAVKAALDATNCNLGDPLTLTLTVSGPIKLEKMFPPKLCLQSNLLEQFTIYDNTVQAVKKSSFNQYLYTIRPTRSGKLEIPPIELSFYDVVSRKYKKVFTAPLPLQVRQGAEITGDQVIASTNKLLTRKEEDDARAHNLAPIRLDNSGAVPAELLGDARIIYVVGGGPAIYALVWLLGAAVRSGRKLREKRHMHAAKSRASRRLSTAARTGRRDLSQSAALICEAARKYLGERLRRGTEAITPAEAINLLKENGINGELAGDFGALYEKYFNACFAGASAPGNAAEDCRKLKELLKRIENELRKKH